MTVMLLFETPHGSHLYGLAHASSDRDVFRVVSKQSNGKARYARQKTDGVDDEMVMDLPTFMSYAARGVPQVLEAMFSQQATFDLIEPLRLSFRPDLRATFQTYRRTARNFLGDGRLKGKPKRVRHAYRIALNFETLAATGRFNPTMTVAEIARMDELMASGADVEAICEAAYSALIQT